MGCVALGARLLEIPYAVDCAFDSRASTPVLNVKGGWNETPSQGEWEATVRRTGRRARAKERPSPPHISCSCRRDRLQRPVSSSFCPFVHSDILRLLHAVPPHRLDYLSSINHSTVLGFLPYYSSLYLLALPLDTLCSGQPTTATFLGYLHVLLRSICTFSVILYLSLLYCQC